MVLLLAAAFAADPPLALPAEPSAVQVDHLHRAPPAVALSTYRARAVSVRRYATLESGGASAIGWGFGWPGFGSPYGGLSTTTLIGRPTFAVERWAVHQGAQRLTVPAWLDVAAAPEDRLDLQKRVRRTRTWHGVLIGLALTGAVTSVGASLASQSAQTYDELLNYRLVSSLGTTALIGGAVGAYGTGMRARTLRYDFDATQDLGSTQERVREHNARLREELGLTGEQTRGIDEGRVGW